MAGAVSAPTPAPRPTHVVGAAAASGTFDDLQRVSERELAFAKARMSSAFEANRVRHGDPEYVHDVQKDFAPKAVSEWDSDDD